MIRLTILIAVLWFAAAPMAAQIFPKIERDAKAPKKAAASGPATVETEPKEQPPKDPVEEPDPDGIDGKRLLARYKELLRGYDNKRKQLKVIEATTDQYHRSVRAFLTGLGLMPAVLTVCQPKHPLEHEAGNWFTTASHWLVDHKVSVAVVTGLVPAGDAFLGFGHPATVTVALVLILSRGLQNAGAVDIVAKYLLPPLARPEALSGHWARWRPDYPPS